MGVRDTIGKRGCELRCVGDGDRWQERRVTLICLCILIHIGDFLTSATRWLTSDEILWLFLLRLALYIMIFYFLL